jgi:tetratricopeptide (TPR) repeat protein
MIKNVKIILLFFIGSLILSGYTRPDIYKIDAAKNAVLHNNLGLEAASEKDYYTAIQEFILAVSLNPNTQSTSIYYNNLGETYMKIGLFKEAQNCFEKAIKQYDLNFLYYKNLIKSFKAQNIIKSKIKFYESGNKKNILNMIVLGLLYIEDGDLSRGITKLDEFSSKEPDLLITGAVKRYLQEIVK